MFTAVLPTAQPGVHAPPALERRPDAQLQDLELAYQSLADW
jgi:hypothetical protein